MRKKIIILILSIFLCGCSYFQVKDAIKEADKGNYISSLTNLLNILKENNEDRRALDAFEIIYPNAEKFYYDKIDLARGRDIINYTKGLLNLLRAQEIYYSLPQVSKNSIAVVEPPLQERNVIKRELAESFYTLGMNMREETYEERLRTYGYFSQAKFYDIEGRKDIEERYNSSKNKALGKFLLNFSGDNKAFLTQLKNTLSVDLKKYPLFSLGNRKNYNLDMKVEVTNIEYQPPSVSTYSGIDSYTDRVVKRVLEKVIETKIVDGKTIQIEKMVPVEREVEVEVYYRYFKHTKKTKMGYMLSYELSEKNGNLISSKKERVSYEDSVTWVEYYPLHPFIGRRPFRFPVTEYEKPVMSKEKLQEVVLEIGSKKLDEVLVKLDSNRKIDW